MTLDFSKLKLSTKGLIAFLLGLGSLLQIPAVGNVVLAAAKTHPHFAVALTVLTGVVTLLHNPQVDAFFGITQTQTVNASDGSSTATSTTVAVTGATMAAAVRDDKEITK
jgi:hypothetical protein